MKGEKNYIMQELFRGEWVDLKGVRITEEAANELNRQAKQDGIRYKEGIFTGRKEANELSDMTTMALVDKAEKAGIDVSEMNKREQIIAALEPKSEGKKEEKPLEERNVAQLKKYAKENNIDLGDATKRVDILAKITADPS